RRLRGPSRPAGAPAPASHCWLAARWYHSRAGTRASMTGKVGSRVGAWQYPPAGLTIVRDSGGTATGWLSTPRRLYADREPGGPRGVGVSALAETRHESDYSSRSGFPERILREAPAVP